MDIAIIPNSPIYVYGEAAKVDVVIYRDVPCEEFEVSFESKFVISNSERKVFSDLRKVKGGVEVSTQFVFEIPRAESSEYVLRLFAKVRGCGEEASENINLSVYGVVQKLVNLVIVWHNHQPPNYLPSGAYFADYPFKWVIYNLFEPYALGGPYYIHAKVYEMFPKVKTTVNLSPSLLAQWREAIERGYVMENGERILPSDRRIELIKETLELYKKLANQNSIEILTSVYAHTILGYLIHRFDMEEVIRDELRLGMEITKEVAGFEPHGVWTPEMAWHNRLGSIYADMGLEYTILCGKSHFTRAIGDKTTIYEPYEFVGNGKRIKILFRDQAISDLIGFRNNFANRVEALKAALDTVLNIVSRRGFVTIALDGENWMIFSKYPKNTYPYFVKLYEYINTLQEKGFLKSLTGYEAVKTCGDSCRKILYIPTNSWVNSFHKWDGELNEQRYMWFEIEKAYQRLKIYKQLIGETKDIKEAYWALYHAIDSDYWWTEFWNPRVIKTWLEELHKTLNSIKIV
ncbi:glycoside hydrolase family 57 protein [Ignisphaera sp. 4213-co]|uniref:Glycoside hydrolase family 57 protein n=1 Tax=Ignisphaera cupida TaxID=3050454 RepID=A0ABD4Z4B7_9CREN|nr:glycoside hydrolase family 57 protein [Ignisphaera sp. 4213-co]MDK6028166.1 glycoside hydrolase family 57 protein [Ignisphaera sp. 4213-co]